MTPAEHERIDKRIVHRARPENVVISDVRRISEEPEEFECYLIVDTTHGFFFDHPLDHVPGMLFMEAGRQMGIALSHLFLGVADETQFISHDFRIRFDDIAELDVPVVIRARFSDRTYRKGRLASARLVGRCLQQGKLVCSLEGDWVVFDRKVYQRLRRRVADGEGARAQGSSTEGESWGDADA